MRKLFFCETCGGELKKGDPCIGFIDMDDNYHWYHPLCAPELLRIEESK